MAKSKKSKGVSKNRPVGATIVAVYYFIVGIFGLIASIMILTVGSTIINMLTQGALFKYIGAAVGFVLLVLSILYLIVGYGIWRLKKWAQIVATVLAVFGLFGGPFGIVLSIAVILLLWVHKKQN